MLIYQEELYYEEEDPLESLSKPPSVYPTLEPGPQR